MRGPGKALRTPTRPTYHRAVRAPLALVAAVLGLGVAAPAAGAWQLVIEGAGEGHGVGMSQDGALGLAKHGFTDTQILSHYYSGITIGTAPANTVVRVLEGSKVVRVPLERYVRGVVAAEMPASWPLAALEAQAIASRTYALTAHAGGSRFDVYADTRSQVYKGAAAETSQSNAAIAATAGQIVTYAGQPAVTYFFASSGGHTENVQYAFEGSEPEPWLQGVSDPYETTTSHWKYTLSSATAAARLAGLFKGTLRGIEVLRRGELTPDPARRGARHPRRHTRDRNRARVPPRPAQHVGLLRTAQRLHHHRRARPQRPHRNRLSKHGHAARAPRAVVSSGPHARHTPGRLRRPGRTGAGHRRRQRRLAPAEEAGLLSRP